MTDKTISNNINQNPMISNFSRFNSMNDAKNDILTFCSLNKIPFKIKSGGNRFSLICDKEIPCSFSIYCNQKSDGYVYIKEINLQHTCSVNDGVSKMAITNLVSDKTLEIGKKERIKKECFTRCKRCDRIGHTEKTCDY